MSSKIENVKARCRTVMKADAALETGPSAAALALECIEELEAELERVRAELAAVTEAS